MLRYVFLLGTRRLLCELLNTMVPQYSMYFYLANPGANIHALESLQLQFREPSVLLKQGHETMMTQFCFSLLPLSL